MSLLRMSVALTLLTCLELTAQKSEPLPESMKGTPQTVVGFVRDTACLLRNRSATVATDETSRKCIQDCAKSGSPLAILTKSGELYMPLSKQIPDLDVRKRLLPFAGKYVRVTGAVFERAGLHAIEIDRIEVVPGW